jgi:hypothetical protein
MIVNEHKCNECNSEKYLCPIIITPYVCTNCLLHDTHKSYYDFNEEEFIENVEKIVLNRFNISNCLTYYNTVKSDVSRLNQSRLLIKFIKENNLFETFIEEPLKDNKNITEEMMMRLNNFSVYSVVEILNVWNDSEFDTGINFIDKKFDYKIDDFIKSHNNHHLYQEDHHALIKFFYYTLLLFSPKQLDSLIDDYGYDIPAPADAIGCIINRCSPRTFFFDPKSREIHKETIEKFVADVDLEKQSISEILLTEKFIESFLNMLGNEVRIRDSFMIKKWFKFLEKEYSKYESIFKKDC